MTSKESAYQQFVAHVEGKVPDTLAHNETIVATAQEIGFWKRYQMARAIRHRRRGEATPTEIRYIAQHAGVYYYDTPRDIPRRHVPKKKK